MCRQFLGKDIVLNLDIELQEYVYKQLNHRQGSAVVLDPRDNSVLAMASSPSYDPNPFVNGISSKAYRALLNDPAHPLVNRTTLGVYPPASTVKPFMAVAGLEEHVITPSTVRNDHGISGVFLALNQIQKHGEIGNVGVTATWMSPRQLRNQLIPSFIRPHLTLGLTAFRNG
ncbi:penicillin-binding transpeptidase domain-containing protein [Vibrio harveyi]|nr:penicillin-binding transpeptidase domain-containing protein [Vibrio harveyi]